MEYRITLARGNLGAKTRFGKTIEEYTSSSIRSYNAISTVDHKQVKCLVVLGAAIEDMKTKFVDLVESLRKFDKRIKLIFDAIDPLYGVKTLIYEGTTHIEGTIKENIHEFKRTA